LQLKQVPLQASLQQTLSVQWSDVHSASPPQAVPFFERHSPRPLHVVSPEQPESASSVNFGTIVQVPADPGTAHD
jgi:hypothetical protein